MGSSSGPADPAGLGLEATPAFTELAADGLLPAWFKSVNRDTVMLANPLLTMGAASMIAPCICVFTDLFATLVGIFGFVLNFIVISISAARCRIA